MMKKFFKLKNILFALGIISLLIYIVNLTFSGIVQPLIVEDSLSTDKTIILVLVSTSYFLVSGLVGTIVYLLTKNLSKVFFSLLITVVIYLLIDQIVAYYIIFSEDFYYTSGSLNSSAIYELVYTTLVTSINIVFNALLVFAIWRSDEKIVS